MPCKLYIADKRADQDVGSAAPSWRGTSGPRWCERSRSEQSWPPSKASSQKATEETRRNLKALEKNRTAADLRDQLTTRLAKNSLRLEEITKRLVEVDMRVNEQRVRFTDMIRSIKLTNPPKPE